MYSATQSLNFITSQVGKVDPVPASSLNGIDQQTKSLNFITSQVGKADPVPASSLNAASLVKLEAQQFLVNWSS
jgi:hypothetical protein